MLPVVDLLGLALRALAETLKRPEYLMVLGLVLWFVYLQAARTAAMEQHMFGIARRSSAQQVVQALLLGTVGGFLASVLFIGVGISLSDTAIGVIWLLALVLMLAHPRFICFAYAGGLVALSSLLFGVPQTHVPAVVALVGVLHLVEAFLVWVSGHLSAMPMYIKQEDGHVVGGFMLQKVWPIPFVALLAVAVGREMLDANLIQMPDWWPLLKPARMPGPGQELVYLLFPVVAALGYGDFTVSRDPRDKARESAGGLVLYSVLLLAMALGATRWPVWAWIAALFSPVGHELLIQWGRWQERRARPVFVSEGGVMVLDVLPDSPAAQMGLRPGDLIVEVNGEPVRTRQELLSHLEPWAYDIEMVVENRLSPHLGRRKVRYGGRVPPLGVVPAPGPDEPRYVTLQNAGFLGRLWRQWQKRRRQGPEGPV